MALPDDLLDELLSAYLDGAASSDECARAEQLIDSDPEVAERFQAFIEQREHLQAIARSNQQTAYRLPANFADNVVAAAIDHVKSQSGIDHHPLLVADQELRPAGRSDSRISARSITIGVAALAASVLFAIGVLREPAPSDHPAIAENSPAPQETAEHSQSDSPSPVTEMLAESESQGNADSQGSTSEPLPAIDEAGTTEIEPMIAMDAPSSAATIDTPDREPIEASVEQSPATLRPLNTLLVIKVELTEAGRTADSFSQATNTLQFQTSEERPVGNDLAAAANRESGESDLGAPQRVLLLESPAKKLDLLVNALANDRDHVASLSFSLLYAEHDAPILKAVNAARLPDPTRIRHQGRSTPLVGEGNDASVGLWQDEFGDRVFAPITPTTAAMVSSMGSGQPLELPTNAADLDGSLNEEPDQMANILFLIR
ncbi:anti-sigma factor family protein [Rhodopirellula sp. MGV]|uniref:anti-sigma factor family protein n=1 Tax=Rhodopirellula sp. MGV TaxID=2023130 RepID=UPI000B967718|nr:hypothetical protein [Rhodopirellula sp. MGV]OYP36971.1 hypothetical protein CGZ80_06300 [Rhodopirellula sp. MGV]PNY36267.1 hypothetical protein C2E31_14290 [Rhodopirellula baltica]